MFSCFEAMAVAAGSFFLALPTWPSVLATTILLPRTAALVVGPLFPVLAQAASVGTGINVGALKAFVNTIQ